MIICSIMKTTDNVISQNMISRNGDRNMMDENVFVCCEIDEEEDYSDEFKEVVDNIIEYLEDALDVEFEEDECFLQAIDVYDCYSLTYYANLDENGNVLVLKVPIDQFQICLKSSDNKTIISSFCEIDIPQYSQENLNRMKDVLLDFEAKYKNL